MKLNQRMIERAKPADKIQRTSDGMGLYLEIRPSAKSEGECHKHYIWRGTIAGSVTEIRLGKHPWLTLEAARDIAIDYKRMTRRGLDPRQERHTAEAPKPKKTPTLRDCIREAFTIRLAEERKDGGKNLRTRQQFIEHNITPATLAQPVNQITPQDMATAIQPVWTRAAGKTMRTDLKRAFDWATAAGHLSGINPAGECLAAILPRNGHKEKAHKAANYNDMPEIIRAVQDCQTNETGKLAWLFMAHTATRLNEATGAEWAEIDLEAKSWTIPASRMKGGKEHTVPLSAEALEIIEQTRQTGGKTHLFPSPHGTKGEKPISREALNTVREAADIKDRMSNHGCRSAFSTWAYDAGYQTDAIEKCLAHAVGGKIERAYNRSQMLERRREIMEAYSRFITGKA